MNAKLSFVTTYIMGQLGNQMFQLATALAYAWDYKVHPIFPDLNKSEDNISYNRDRVFFQLDHSLLPRKPASSFAESKYYSSKRIPFKKDLVLFGYFQSWKHFDHHRERIVPLFSPIPSIISDVACKYRDLLALPNTVGIHVRTFCKSNHESRLHQFLGMDYFKNAMDLFPQDSVFVVFSDRINWCKNHFPRLNRKFVFIEGNDGIADFFLLSQMKHIILSNSTFSWWAAYMNLSPDKKIVAPKTIIDPKLDPYFPAADYYLPDWTLIDLDFDHSYPTDMESYDKQSQSLNG